MCVRVVCVCVCVCMCVCCCCFRGCSGFVLFFPLSLSLSLLFCFRFTYAPHAERGASNGVTISCCSWIKISLISVSFIHKIYSPSRRTCADSQDTSKARTGRPRLQRANTGPATPLTFEATQEQAAPPDGSSWSERLAMS